MSELIDLGHHLGASVFFMPINGGLPQEDFFAYPGILQDPEGFRREIECGIEKARGLGAEKARDTLEKLLKYWELIRARRSGRLPDPEGGVSSTSACAAVPVF